MRRGQIVREGLHTSLTDLRLRKNHKSARARWQQDICSGPALFVVGRDKGKAVPLLAARVPGGSLRTLPRERGQPGHGHAGGVG